MHILAQLIIEVIHVWNVLHYFMFSYSGNLSAALVGHVTSLQSVRQRSHGPVGGVDDETYKPC